MFLHLHLGGILFIVARDICKLLISNPLTFPVFLGDRLMIRLFRLFPATHQSTEIFKGFLEISQFPTAYLYKLKGISYY